MEVIEAVIFDWGGVLIDDPTPGLMEYCAGVLDVDEEEYKKTYQKFAPDFQRGVISEEEFWSGICRELKVEEPRVNSLWGEAFEIVYQKKEKMFSLAERLQRNTCKTAVLSNAEEPTMRYFYAQKYNMFDAAVFSCAEGVAKPEGKIYELAIEKLGIMAERSVFIDDKREFTAGAKQVGLNAIVFESVGQIEDELVRLGVKIT